IDVTWVGRRALAPIKVGGDRVVADVGEAAGEVADVVGQAERLMDHDDAGIVAVLVRLRQIGWDLGAADRHVDEAALDLAGVGDETGYVGHWGSSCFWSRSA